MFNDRIETLLSGSKAQSPPNTREEDSRVHRENMSQLKLYTASVRVSERQ